MKSTFQLGIDNMKKELSNIDIPEKYVISPYLYKLASEQGFNMESFQTWEPLVIELSDRAKQVEAGLHEVIQKYLKGLR